MARKSEYPAWEKFNAAIKKYRKHLEEYNNAEAGSKIKKRLQNTLRDDGLRLETYFNEQTRYDTTNNPSTILNPSTGKAAGQWHHAATQKRLLPFLLTVKTRQDYVRLTDTFRQYGIGTGNAYQNMFDLTGELHDSRNPAAIHRVEEKAGLDAPDRYLKPGATIDDAIKAVPKLAEDVTGSKRLARNLQHRGMTIGEGSRFSDEVMQTSTEELSQATHDKRARNRQTSQLAIQKREKGLPSAKTITNENPNVVHGEQIIKSPDPEVQNPRSGGTNIQKLKPGEQGVNLNPSQALRAARFVAPVWASIGLGATAFGTSVNAATQKPSFETIEDATWDGVNLLADVASLVPVLTAPMEGAQKLLGLAHQSRIATRNLTPKKANLEIYKTQIEPLNPNF